MGELFCWAQVDDKYQYSCENTDNSVHGWISLDSDAPVGFWMITPSNEFRNAGPIKQDLTSHVGPITLSVRVPTSSLNQVQTKTEHRSINNIGKCLPKEKRT